MDDHFVKILQTALDRLADHVDSVGLENTNESTFRSFFLASLMARFSHPKCQLEWHAHDMLAQVDDQNVLIEFKFNIFRYRTELDGQGRSQKGGAGALNQREFADCVRKLHHCGHSLIHWKYLVLAYEIIPPSTRMKSFSDSYDSIAPGAFDGSITNLYEIPHRLDNRLSCKLLRIA